MTHASHGPSVLPPSDALCSDAAVKRPVFASSASTMGPAGRGAGLVTMISGPVDVTLGAKSGLGWIAQLGDKDTRQTDTGIEGNPAD